MNQTAVLIPFKAVRKKSRLFRVLAPNQRRWLAELMLLDVLGAFSKAGLLPRCYVVTSDRKVLSLVRSLGAQTIVESRDNGVNAAVGLGVRTLGRDCDFVVVPSDLPLIAPGEIRNALALKRSLDCIISPSRSFDGTNLLIFTGKAAPALSYDSDSFWNHVAGAARKTLSLAVYCGEGILLDIDTLGDLRVLSRARRRSLSVEFAKEALKRRAS